jgi:hypothetical protein
MIMKSAGKALLALLLIVQNSLAQKTDDYDNQIMAGISNRGQNKTEPYLSAGDRSYIVGTQDGNFPDLGSHVKGEMGGLWMQPIKLMDGFWVRLTDADNSSESWLNEAREFINYPYGNRFFYDPVLNGIEAERFQFCPQGKPGMVIQYQIKNTTSQLRKLQLEFVVKTDLSPVWFSKENNIIDATDTIFWMQDKKIFAAKDNRNPWFTVWGSSQLSTSYNAQANPPIATMGLGKAASTNYQLEIKPHEEYDIVFVISGSSKNLDSANTNYEDLIKNNASLLQEKKRHYGNIIRRARLDIPDKKLQQVYTWNKINTEWLVSNVPGIGVFLGAGAIEYPWLFGCDNSYALQGVIATGNPDLAKATLRLIKKISEKTNGNGRIIHEMSTNGFVYNKGNTQETPHFALAVWIVFEWTGDKEFLREMYPYIKKGIHWLLTDEDQNKNMFPEGYGIMEVKGLNAELIDVAVYTQQALEVVIKMAEIFNEPDVKKDFMQKAIVLKEKINTLFWDNDEGSYCDFYGTKEQALSVAKGALEQLHQMEWKPTDSAMFREKEKFYQELEQKFSNLPPGTKRGWFTNKNWVVSVPAEMGIAPKEKAIRLLNKVRTEDCGDYGPYLSAVEKRHMMTISTGVQAVAECTYDRTDEAMWYVERIVETFGKVLPGSISEMMPDYGCPVQAWTSYGLAVPLVTYILGINPDAFHKSIIIEPHIPSGWDHAAIEELPVGNNMISFAVHLRNKSSAYSITSVAPDWTCHLKIKGLNGRKYKLNGKLFIAGSDQIELKGRANNVEVLQ